MSMVALDDLPAINDVTTTEKLDTTDNVIAEDTIAAPAQAVVPAQTAASANTSVPIQTGFPTETVIESQPEPRIASGTLTLVPADERLPSGQGQLSRSTASNVTPNAAASRNTASAEAPPPARTEIPAAYAPPTDEFSPFQVPLINSLEQGKWYVQLGVYSRPDNVEDEISRIGTSYPVAVQNIGSDTSPMFRVLLGPLNQGESGAMLQRFKSIGYADAFLRNK